MTTSNSINYSETREEIVTDALALLGIVGEGETATTDQINFCSRFLNKIVKSLVAKSGHQWLETEGTLFLTEGVNEYVISSDNTLDKAGINTIETVIGSSSSGTSITVDYTDGMQINDTIGVVQDDNTIAWSTIASVDSDIGLTLNDALTDTASEGNAVFVYTNKVKNPLKVIGVRFRNADLSDLPIKLVSKAEYMDITNKTVPSERINMVHFSRQRDTGRFYIWPTPDNVNCRLEFTYIRPIEDMDSDSDTLDFLQEYHDLITHKLAVRIAPSYGKKLTKDFPEILTTLLELQNDMDAWDEPNGSTKIIPGDE